MQFFNILGHKNIINNLRNLVDSNKIPHAILFTEKPGYGAINLALATIQYIFCKDHKDGDSCGICNSCNKVNKLIHPDLHFIFPLNTSTTIGGDKRADVDTFYPAWRILVKENPYFTEQQMNASFGIENKFGIISVAESNAIIKKLSLNAYEGGAKVMLIMFPERMNLEAANKLLKSLEEPLPNTYYFLISHNPQKIISTILSRCRIIEIPPIQEDILCNKLAEQYNFTKEEAYFWAKCSGMSYGKAVEIIARDEQQSNNYTTFVNILNLAIQRNLPELFNVWENLSTWGKENQKDFCIESSDILRKIYMINLNLEELSYASIKERNELRDLSKKIKTNFYEKGYNYLNNALDCIERNVNPKFIFCDLCNRIYYNI